MIMIHPNIHSFDEVLTKVEARVVETLHFIKQVVTECVNPTESDAFWHQYRLWGVYYTNFLKELSYGVVLKNFPD